jgi:hypothetical protein
VYQLGLLAPLYSDGQCPKVLREESVVRNRTGSTIEQILRAARVHGAADQSDGHLLGQFLAQREEAAFVALVQRHGPMV